MFSDGTDNICTVFVCDWQSLTGSDFIMRPSLGRTNERSESRDLAMTVSHSVSHALAKAVHAKHIAVDLKKT